jgi:thymidine kinase
MVTMGGGGMREHLTAITGPMFSGKSLELIKRVDMAEAQKKDVVCYTPTSRYTDKGDDKTRIKSRHGLEIEAFHLDSKLNGYKLFTVLSETIRLGFRSPDVIAIDEAQFFPERELWFAIDEMMHHYGVNFIVAGLTRDYAGSPFGAMPKILTMADEVVQLFAICNKCRSADGTRTVRMTEDKEQIILGSDIYNVHCSTCHWKFRKTEDELQHLEKNIHQSPSSRLKREEFSL